MTTPPWHPTASLSTLQKRATILSKIRTFFADRQVLEVETPLLSHATVTDPYVIGIPANFHPSGASTSQTMYLQTSPEYAMKRLLAAGAGAIYQICKAFRQDDAGRLHNPEFTMLEWYRPGFDHHALMDEMDDLLQLVLETSAAERLTYAALFQKYVNINPHTINENELIAVVKQQINLASPLHDRRVLLDLLMTHCIEPHIGHERPLFIYDYPADQAALAKIRTTENPPVASRFEVFFKGIELANGFHELQNVTEQRNRFQQDLIYRTEHAIPAVPIDERFLAALAAGLPDCAGVALGVDRLVMLALGNHSLATSMSFAFEQA